MLPNDQNPSQEGPRLPEWSDSLFRLFLCCLVLPFLALALLPALLPSPQGLDSLPLDQQPIPPDGQILPSDGQTVPPGAIPLPPEQYSHYTDQQSLAQIPPVIIVIDILFMVGFVVGITWYLLKREGMSLASTFGLELPRTSRLWELVLAASGISLAMSVVVSIGTYWLLQLFQRESEYQEMVSDAIVTVLGLLSDGSPQERAEHGLRLFLMALAVVVVAPITEEILFRGVLYSGLRTRVGNAPAIGISAAFFSLAHLHAEGIVPFALLGIILAWTYQKSGVLAVPILVHAIFNLVNLAFIVLLCLFEQYFGQSEPASILPW